MPLRKVHIPSLARRLSCLMAAPSSADAATHAAGLDTYHAVGGDSYHLHGEGGETHSRQATGDWLRLQGRREQSFVCTQVCHDAWDAVALRPVDRFTPWAVLEDITADLALLGIDFIDMVYLDDRPGADFTGVLEALASEIAAARIQAVGLRNWTPDRIRAAHDYAVRMELPRCVAIVTTEMALFTPTAPLWPGYVPFDAGLRSVVRELGLAVFAHVDDLTIGQSLFADAEARDALRPEWLERWRTPDNMTLKQQVQALAATIGASAREINVAWLLTQDFPVIGIIGVPALLGKHGPSYERAAQLSGAAELAALKCV